MPWLHALALLIPQVLGASDECPTPGPQGVQPAGLSLIQGWHAVQRARSDILSGAADGKKSSARVKSDVDQRSGINKTHESLVQRLHGHPSDELALANAVTADWLIVSSTLSSAVGSVVYSTGADKPLNSGELTNLMVTLGAGVTALVAPMLGPVLGVAVPLLSAVLTGLLRPTAPSLEDTLNSFYGIIMRDVNKIIKQEIVRSRSHTVMDQVAQRVKDINDAPLLYEDTAARYARYRQIMHQLEEDATAVFGSGGCMDHYDGLVEEAFRRKREAVWTTPTSFQRVSPGGIQLRHCGDWIDGGVPLTVGLLFADMHLSLLGLLKDDPVLSRQKIKDDIRHHALRYRNALFITFNYFLGDGKRRIWGGSWDDAVGSGTPEELKMRDTYIEWLDTVACKSIPDQQCHFYPSNKFYWPARISWSDWTLGQNRWPDYKEPNDNFWGAWQRGSYIVHKSPEFRTFWGREYAEVRGNLDIFHFWCLIDGDQWTCHFGKRKGCISCGYPQLGARLLNAKEMLWADGAKWRRP